MKVILFAGSEDRDTILELALQDRKLRVSYLKFDDLIEFPGPGSGPDLSGFSRDPERVKRFTKLFNRRLAKAIKKSRKGLLLINGYFTLGTSTGFAPVLNEEFMLRNPPDIVVLFEPDTSLMKRDSPERAKQIELCREIDRNFAAVYSTLTGCELKIVEVRPGHVRDAVKEVRSLITRLSG